MFQQRNNHYVLEMALREMLRAVQTISLSRSFGPGRRSSTRINTGYAHPHSSKRQRDRYARQIKAGQLNMAGCRKVTP
ncbi:hypothetical protein GOZ80_06065 [Agrobacterium vitis]|uniref:hypothetical protein n=1 Tax=Agrobacterium vitis TaxID=373 RepID=UPI0012E8B619|nr:hypothetical protein [Agrobacterium vitis]MVA91585.1 hypothetical protein [Agrobacterium vitis]MVB00510.1 hypothetical protein [Agrobacterium vitis]